MEKMMMANGLEAAFMGIGRQFNKYLAVYSEPEVIAVFVTQGMSPDEAVEFYEFNTVGAYVGEGTPLFLRPMNLEEVDEELELEGTNEQYVWTGGVK